MESQNKQEARFVTAGDIAREVVQSLNTPVVPESNPTKQVETLKKTDTETPDEKAAREKAAKEFNDEAVVDDEIFPQFKIKRQHLHAIQKRNQSDTSIRATEFWQCSDEEFERSGRF